MLNGYLSGVWASQRGNYLKVFAWSTSGQECSSGQWRWTLFPGRTELKINKIQ